MKLKDKVIVITGASQGLGRTLAYKVAQEGAQVILVARSEKLLQKVQTDIIKKAGKAAYFVCDISDSVAVQKTVKRILKQFLTIDILVNNAGIWTDDILEKEHPERKKQAFDTNALGNIQFAQEVLPYFEKNNEGYIFNVISTSGLSDLAESDSRFWSTYAATKWAFAGFTKALQDRLQQTKIKITGFFPGGFDSNLYENAGNQNAHKQPWMMKSEDVADIIIFALTRPADVVMERIVVTKVTG